MTDFKPFDQTVSNLSQRNADKDQRPFLVDNACPLKGRIKLLKNDKVIENLSLEEIEPISNQYFGQILHDSLEQDKGMIVGRVQTRDRVQFKRSYHHCFYAPNLIKILFKTPFLFTDEALVSRYHPAMPLTVRNPLTNEIIVGEVEFFLVGRQAVVASKEVEAEAKFIGSDYNYALSQEFRQQFVEHSMEQDQAKLQLAGRINQSLANDPEF